MSEVFISFLVNIVFALVIVSLVFRPKAIQWYKNHKKLGERKANLRRANRVKEIRTEVRRYLKELQND